MHKSRVDLWDNARLERAIMHVAFGVFAWVFLRVRRKIVRRRTYPQRKVDKALNIKLQRGFCLGVFQYVYPSQNRDRVNQRDADVQIIRVLCVIRVNPRFRQTR